MKKNQKESIEEKNQMILNINGSKTDIGTFYQIKGTNIYFVSGNSMKFSMNINDFAKLNNVNPEIINDIKRKVQSEENL